MVKHSLWIVSILTGIRGTEDFKQMTDYIIGILGGYGHVGLHAARYLVDVGNCSILIGGRDLNRGNMAAGNLGSRASACHVDIYDAQSLHAFCGSCNLVLNCAGPYEVIRERVALAALTLQKHYVDVSGPDSLYTALVPYEKTIRQKGLVFIISAGMLPGLSGILPVFTARHDFDVIDSLEYFYCGIDEFTFTSAYDYVCSLQDGSGMGMAYFRKGNIERKGVTPIRGIKLPYFDNLLDAYPYTNGEMQRLSESLGGCTVYFYNVFPGKHTLETLNYIQASRQYHTEKEKRHSAELLVYASQQDLLGNNTKQVYYFVMHGKHKGKSRKTHQTLYSRNGYELTGTVAAITSLLVFTGRITGPRVNFLPQGVDVEYFMDKLRMQPVLEHFTLTRHDEDIIEEGII